MPDWGAIFEHDPNCQAKSSVEIAYFLFLLYKIKLCTRQPFSSLLCFRIKYVTQFSGSIDVSQCSTNILKLNTLSLVPYTMVRLIPVSGIGRSAPLPVVLSFVYLSPQSTLLQRTPVVSSLYCIFAHIPLIHMPAHTCTLHKIAFSVQKKLYSQVLVSV